MDGKNFNLEKFIDNDIILTSSKINEEILSHLHKYTKDRSLLEIGCGEGEFAQKIKCSEYTGVDPYSKSKSNKIIKEDALEFLEKLEDKSLEVLLGKGVIHYFNWPILKDLLQKKLKKEGVALFYNISESTKLFENEEFNEVFMNNFSDAPYTSEKLNVEYFVSEEQMRNMAKSKCWTNHQHLKEEEIKRLVELVPSKNEPLKLKVDVNFIKFEPSEDK